MTSSRRFLSVASATVLAAAVYLAPLARAAEPLLLQWGTIDTSSDAAQAESAALKAKVAKKAAAARKSRAAAETRAAYIVQFPGPVADEWREWLESATQVRGYLPEFAYLVWATPSEMETIAANENVFWTDEWKKEYKTVRAGTASAAKTAASTVSEARWMQVGSLLTGDDGTADLRARLEALPATVRSAFPRLDGSSAIAFLTDAQIDEVASWPDVEWIEPKLQPRLFNDKAARTNMMNVTNAWKAISSGGLGLTGSGQIVAVADTGCDTGDANDIHADFAGRVKAGYGWTNGAYRASASWADIDAHGTHVCGSVLGSGAKSSGQFRGMAYEAQLVMQGMWEDLGGLPDYTGDMLKQAYTNGARIHSDSWGFGTNYSGKYVYDSIYADEYMWTNQNFIMVIAAGNDGIDANSDGVIDPGSVSCPGTAKNCLCVGAAENYRDLSSTWGGSWPSDYPAAPIKSDKISQTTTPQGLAAFSGRGPTLDGRFKPDIVAPGTDVISVRGRLAEDEGWGIYTSNTNYLYEGGTSMATPLTSGALALVRQWLVDRKGINEPMAALMKALLINGARDMTPGQYGTGAYQEITARPDRSQGFGHVNLYNSLEPGAGNFLVFATNRITATGNNFTTNIAVGQANAGTYVLTLAWQDYPGDNAADKALVNDLDLTVTSPSGTIYYPNNYGKLDHTNNVEFIEFTATETGDYAVKVNGYNVAQKNPHGGQPFALVMRGPETVVEDAAPEFSSATSSTNGVQYEDIEFPFSSLLTQGYPSPTYHVTSDVSEDEYDYDDATGYFYFTPQSYGTFTFQCVASNALGTATNTLTVTVTQAPPAVPTGLTLSDIASSSFTASWDAVGNADSYRVDVVQGDSFEATVGDPVLEANFSSTSGWTLSGTGTYNGSDYCGNSVPSIKFDGTGDYAISPDFGSGVKLQFWAYGNGGSGSTFIISGLVNSVWAHIETVAIANGADTYEVTLPSGTSQVKFDFVKSVNCGLDDVIVYGPGAAAGEYVTGWSNATVNATSANVTGLSPSTTYAVRVRAVNNAGTSDNSATATATTLAGLSAPAWTAIPPQTVDVGTNCWLNLADYVSGSPTPTISLVSSTATSADYEFEDDYLMFAPPAASDYTFTFMASNSVGTSNATLTVTGHTEPPVLTASLGTSLNSTVGENVEFTVTATGIPAPTTIGATCTEGTFFVFEDGGFLFDSPAVGTYHFVFTTTTVGGTDTLTVTVTVSAAPVTVPELTITDIADTSALATWTACTGVSTYTLQLASDDQFTAGGSGGGESVELVNEGFNNGTTLPTGWTVESGSIGGTYTTSGNYGNSSPSLKLSAAVTISTPLLSNPTNVSFWYKGNPSGTSDITSTLVVEQLVGGTWSEVDTPVITKTATTPSYPLNSSATQVRFIFTKDSGNLAFDDVVITGTSGPSGSSGSSLISSDTVSGTSHTFTNLTPETTYYARVKGTSDWSPVVSFTTTATSGSTPFEDWLEENNASGHAADDTASNGHTYWENYIADTDPTSTNFLEVTFASTTNGTLSIVPFSSNRTYQLLYWTNILSGPATNTIDPANPTIPTNATGFGRVRVTLPTSP